MATTKGSIIEFTDFNALYTRLNTMRASHVTATSNAGQSTTAIASAFAVPTAKGNKISVSDVTALKTNIDALAASYSFSKNKGTTATTITVPTVGALIKATDYDGWNTVITNMEKVCANYGRYGSQYGHYSGKYDHYSGDYNRYSWYTQRYTGQYSKTTKTIF